MSPTLGSSIWRLSSVVSRLLLSILGAACLGLAHGAERVGDARHAYALERHAESVAALESDVLWVLEALPDDDRFDLYRTYNHIMGAWAQVALSQALLDLAVAAALPPDEEALRTTLRDQAQFALWDLDDTRGRLERDIASITRADHLRISEAARSLLVEMRATIVRLLVDQCARLPCSLGR